MLKHLATKIMILCWFIVPAQVQVKDELRHHNVFENEQLRILDVYLAPKDTTAYHLHNTPSVFIMFTNTKLSSQLLGEQPIEGANVVGEIFYDSLVTPRIHRVWNEDTSWFHVMDIELTSKHQRTNPAIIKNPDLTLLFNAAQVNVYSAKLKSSNKLQLPSSLSGYLLVSKTEIIVDYKINSTIQHRIMKPSHYIWVGSNNIFSIENKDHKTGEFAVLQLK
jgi:hypothetical protein